MIIIDFRLKLEETWVLYHSSSFWNSLSRSNTHPHTSTTTRKHMHTQNQEEEGEKKKKKRPQSTCQSVKEEKCD